MHDEMTHSLWGAGGVVYCRNEVPGNRLGNAGWFNTAKPGGEQISLKENVERAMEGQNDADNTMGSVLSRLLWWSSRSRGAWINPCCSEVILQSCFQFRLYCWSSLLLTLCAERTLDATCALTSHVAQHRLVVSSHHESQAKRVTHRRD